MTAPLKSQSQFGQTDFVIKSLGHKRNGFFIELGADDGFLTSNTLLLENGFGWDGICIEPVAERYRLLLQNRKCRTDSRCVSGVEGERVFFKVDKDSTIFSGITDYMSTYKDRSGDTVEMITVTLNSVLKDHDAPPVIDYLSLDTEGSEFQILSGFDFHKYKFRVITVEHNHEEAKRKSIRDLLEMNDYVLVDSLGVDDCYFHRELVPRSTRQKAQIIGKTKAAISWLRKTVGLRTRLRRLFTKRH